MPTFDWECFKLAALASSAEFPVSSTVFGSDVGNEVGALRDTLSRGVESPVSLVDELGARFMKGLLEKPAKAGFPTLEGSGKIRDPEEGPLAVTNGQLAPRFCLRKIEELYKMSDARHAPSHCSHVHHRD